MRTIVDLVESPAIMSASAAMTVERGNTGRILHSHTEDQWRSAKLVDEWFRCDFDEFVRHPARDVLKEALGQVQAYGIPTEVFRGRMFPTGSPTPSSMELGPPPARLAEQQRYSRYGKPALYTANSIEGVRAELAKSVGDDVAIFVQRFVIGGANLKIADLATNELPAIVMEAFDRSERTSGITDYRKSCYLAELVAERFDGMRVPGVRGSREERYFNIVIFDPADRWRRWLAESDPELV